MMPSLAIVYQYDTILDHQVSLIQLMIMILDIFHLIYVIKNMLYVLNMQLYILLHNHFGKVLIEKRLGVRNFSSYLATI